MKSRAGSGHAFSIAILLTIWAQAGCLTCVANADEALLRFYQGVTAYVDNPDGRDFDVKLGVREWNLVENGPREVLVKVYDPDGRAVVREVIPDDGVTGEAFMPEAGGWDHEMWYYALCYSRGTVPMIRWSSLSDAGRVKTLVMRSFTYRVKGGSKGIYRVLICASRDHVVGMELSPGLKYGLAGHPSWMHGHGDMFGRTYVYVPKGTDWLHVAFIEHDQPITRNFRITAEDGTVLWDGPAKGGFQDKVINFEKPGQYDDQLLTVDVSDGAGAYLMHVQLGRMDIRFYRGKTGGGVPAIFVPDQDTARALKGGAIYHDGKVFWHMYQVRLHEWLKTRSPENFVVHDADGKVVEPSQGRSFGWGAASLTYKGLPGEKNFIPLNGNHEAPPLCDTLMNSYVVRKDPGILNVAIRDLEHGLASIVVGDVPALGRWIANMGYVFGTYSFHYWRPAWRILQLSDAPEEVKAIIREAIIMCGDRLAFSRGIERTNGNALSHIPMALRYASEGAQDPLLTELADQYRERFASEGWGRGAGISRSGDCQEHFAHDFAYGTYILANYRALMQDLNDPRFGAILNRVNELYTYLYCSDAIAYPWSSRTSQQAGAGRSGWKAEPGPDFTVSVNGGDEWFAARRANYYALTFHGRLAPTWLNNYFASKLGYGGGILCQVTVLGSGTVIASQLADAYGKGMQPRNWAQFQIHSVVGTLASGEPLVAADSEHLNAKLNGRTVSGDGEVRDCPIHVTRNYTFDDSSITCHVHLSDTYYRAALWNQGPSSKLQEAYEMIPFVPGTPKKNPTTVSFQDASGTSTVLDARPVSASGIVIDRSGFGAKIVFDSRRTVKLGAKNTVLVQLIDAPAVPESVVFDYVITPYTGEPGAEAAPPAAPNALAKLTDVDTLERMTELLRDAIAFPARVGSRAIAEVRFGIAGDKLAVLAQVTDAKINPKSVAWQGSCVEVFGSMAPGKKIGQIFLVPAAGEVKAAAYAQRNDKQTDAPEIMVKSVDRPGGYEIAALVPLSLLAIEDGAGEVLLEGQVTATAGSERQEHATLFGSTRAYQNNRQYGVFKVPDSR